jgi:hypothetical protein
MAPTTNPDPGLTEGERRRDAAHALIRARRAALARRVQRAFVRHLLDHGADTTDPVRDQVPIPLGTDPRLVGAAVREQALAELIRQNGRRRSRRPVAHGRDLPVWAIIDRAVALDWLREHADIADPEPDVLPAGFSVLTAGWPRPAGPRFHRRTHKRRET